MYPSVYFILSIRFRFTTKLLWHRTKESGNASLIVSNEPRNAYSFASHRMYVFLFLASRYKMESNGMATSSPFFFKKKHDSSSCNVCWAQNCLIKLFIVSYAKSFSKGFRSNADVHQLCCTKYQALGGSNIERNEYHLHHNRADGSCN